jgi:hypothetical protein
MKGRGSVLESLDQIWMNLLHSGRLPYSPSKLIKMIRRLVEELERAQLEVEELRHDVREQKKKNKDFQNLLEEMVYSFVTH